MEEEGPQNVQLSKLCFSFEAFVTLNPIQVNIQVGGPTY